MSTLAVPNLFERLVEQLVQEREVQGLTQRQLAERLQTTQPAVAKLEAGTDFRVSTLLRWAAALGKVVDPLLVEAVSGLGDPSGVFVGTVYPDGTPLLLDLHGPLGRNRLPLLLLSGRPGSGKSHLLRILVSQLAADGTPGLVLGRAGDGSVETIVGQPPSRLADLSSPLKGIAGLELFTRDLPTPGTSPSYWSSRERTAAAALEEALSAALALVPSGGFVVVEEVGLLGEFAEKALFTLWRSARAAGIAVVLSAQCPSDLQRWASLGARVLALSSSPGQDTVDALALCGLESSQERLREVSALWSAPQRYALFCDLDGRTAPVVVGGTSLRT